MASKYATIGSGNDYENSAQGRGAKGELRKKMPKPSAYLTGNLAVDNGDRDPHPDIDAIVKNDHR
jgi:hypothetical protein